MWSFPPFSGTTRAFGYCNQEHTFSSHPIQNNAGSKPFPRLTPKYNKAPSHHVSHHPNQTTTCCLSRSRGLVFWCINSRRKATDSTKLKKGHMPSSGARRYLLIKSIASDSKLWYLYSITTCFIKC